MQTIENSLLQVSVDEKGAQLARLLAKTKRFNYLQDQDRTKKMPVIFQAVDHSKNWALLLPWTVVDKGDARVSMTMIDNASSYRQFPYHFELMLTYALEGNQLALDFYVKNNSNKAMAFKTGLILPVPSGWQIKHSGNKVIVKGPKDQLSMTSLDLKAHLSQAQITCLSDEVKLADESDRHLKASFILA